MGRSTELQTLRLGLQGTRLLTLVGAAGVGKTRLAVECGRQLAAGFEGGVWWCDLSEARDAAGICRGLAAGLDVPLTVGDPVDQLAAAIHDRGRALLLLDNFEQVARHAHHTLAVWLDASPKATFLITSREPLGLPGERRVVLEPLPLAPLELGESVGDLAALADTEAVRLFAERAHAVQPRFHLDGPTLRSVAAIVRALDGNPLAIELAAARCDDLSPEGIRRRLSSRFELLRGTQALPALRGAIDWSWDLLATWERAVLAYCSVFRGGFTVEAASAVVNLARWPDREVSVVLEALLAKSLLHQPDRHRLAMDASVAAYASEKLAAHPDGPDTQARHRAYYQRFGEEDQLDGLTSRGSAGRLRALGAELDNLTVALAGAVEVGDGVAATAICRAALVVLLLRGPLPLAVELCEKVLAMEGLRAADRARLLTAEAQALQYLGHSEGAAEAFEAALKMATGLGDRWLEGRLRGWLATPYRHLGRMAEAEAMCRQALAINREHDNHPQVGIALGELGAIAWYGGRLDEAQTYLREALAIHYEVGNRREEAIALGRLAILHVHAGRLALAEEAFQSAIAIHQEVGDRRFEAVSLMNLGELIGQAGRLGEARAYLEAALALQRQVGDVGAQGATLDNLARTSLAEGRPAAALEHIEAGLIAARRIDDHRTEGLLLSSRAAAETQQGDFAAARRSVDRADTLLRRAKDRFELARLLCRRGFLDLAEGKAGDACTALDEAARIAADFGGGADPTLTPLLVDLREAVRQAIQRR